MVRRCCVMILLALVVQPAAAQAIKITSVRVGLPPTSRNTISDGDGQPAYVFKANMWAPVYVEFEMLREVKDEAFIHIEASDPDALGTSTVVPLMPLADKPPTTKIQAAELPYLPMVRASGREMVVSIKNARGRNLAEAVRLEYLRYRETNSYVVLGLGSRLPGFDIPPDKANQTNPGVASRTELAAIDNINMLPDRWYGYDGVDLAVLATGTVSIQNFLAPLLTEPQYKPRLDALLEWVRRGGRLVVSGGANALLISNFAALQELLPVTLRKEAPSEQVPGLALEWKTKTTNKALGRLAGKPGSTFPILQTTPKADRGAKLLMPADLNDGPDVKPAVWQAPYGLGRVTLVGFDLDRSPFVDSELRTAVWDVILKECGSERAYLPGTRRDQYYGNMLAEDELATDLRGHTDWFAGVPVISFGWVALFIVLYTLLIGPVEYFVLKKVFKRLELTWITFPIIVLSVSAIAYFSAYAMKGSDMKVNKVDLVDIDLGSNRIYGRTWVTVFSPRIDTYTVGLEPKANWIASGEQPHGGSLVDWSGGGRAGKTSFFRRSYDYAQQLPGQPGISQYSEGLLNVPIQVWSTKAFTADWSALLDKQKPLVVSNLYHPPLDRDSKTLSVAGQFTLNLPFPELHDVYLIYAGQVYRPTTDTAPITPGHIENAFLDASRVEKEGLEKVLRLAQLTTPTDPRFNQYNRRGRSSSTSTGVAPIFNLMFHELGLRSDMVPSNATLRRLDQSWRLTATHQDELIVIGRTKMVQDANAEQLLSDPNSNSPTQLWLKGLPGQGKPRSPQQGLMQQETFVRIFIPIKPLKK